MDMNFLPADYKPPRASDSYMKIADGENKFRIMSKPITGWEDWIDNKPVRYRNDEKPAKSFDPNKPIKHFWSFVVWNCLAEKIQILHITQATIRNAIMALNTDSDWGSPFYYDLKINKKGEGVKSEYSVNPTPKRDVHDYILEQFEENRCWLEALYTNEDPFSTHWPQYTPCAQKAIKVMEKEKPDLTNLHGVKVGPRHLADVEIVVKKAAQEES